MKPKELKLKSERLLEILKAKERVTIDEISSDPAIDVNKEEVFPLVDKLRKQGHPVKEGADDGKRVFYLDKGEALADVSPSLPPITRRDRIEVLFMSDICLGLVTQQPDLLATCLKIGEERKVFFNVIVGNLVAGKPVKTGEDEYFLKTAEEQAAYVVSCFPRASFNTYLLIGHRELSFDKGKERVRIERLICPQREDIRLIGEAKEIITIGSKEAKVAIAAIMGSAYTKSYPLQGVMENFQEAVHYIFEHSEPFRAAIVGGLHSGILIPRQLPVSDELFNDFDGVAIPSLCRITPSQAVSRKRGASPVLGCLVLGANFKKSGEFSGFTYAFYDLTAYFKDNNYLEEPAIRDDLSEEAKNILLRLKNKPARRGELSRLIGKSESHVESVIRELRDKGYDIRDNEARRAYELRRTAVKKTFQPIDLSSLFVTKVRVLATSDWHVGHELAREDLIKRVIKLAEEKQVDVITNSGNLFEGFKSYKGQEQEVMDKGADAQRKKLMKLLPKSKIPMVLISSPGKEHDAVFRVECGHDIVDTFVEIAKLYGYRIEYLKKENDPGNHHGHGTFKLKDMIFDLQHPKGGLPYGQTYRIQRRIEMLVSKMELARGVKATFIGHLHRAAFMLFKGVAGFLVPALEETTDYINALDKMGELGAWIAEFAFDGKQNLTKVELEYVPFKPKLSGNHVLDLDTWKNKWAAEDGVAAPGE